MSAKSAVAFEGRYGIAGESNWDLEVKRSGGDRMLIELSTNGCLGTVRGRANVSGGVMTVDDGDCRLTLMRTPAGLRVTQGRTCSFNHGARCQFAADWVRRGAPPRPQRAAGAPMPIGPQTGVGRNGAAAAETRPARVMAATDRYPWSAPTDANWRSLGVVALHMVSDEANTVFGAIACRTGQISIIRGGYGGEPEDGPTTFEIDGRRIPIYGRVERAIETRIGPPGIRAPIDRGTLLAMRDAMTIRITGVRSSGASLRRIWPRVAAACGV